MAIEEVRDEVQTVEQTAPAQPEIDYKAEYEKLLRDNDKLKRAQSNASADVSRLKKELNEKLSADERAKRDIDEELARLRSENSAYKERERIVGYTEKLLSVGYDPETARKMASGLPEGVDDSFFESQRTFLESTKNQYRAEALNAQPKPSVGTTPTAQTAAEARDAQMKKIFGLT